MKNKLSQLFLEDTPRKFQFPLRVQRIGSYRSMGPESFHGRIPEEHIEFCLRLGSPTDCAVDRIDGVEYRNHFPHLLLKKPGMTRDAEWDQGRIAFFIIYKGEAMSTLETLGFPLDKLAWEIHWTPELNKLLGELTDLFPSSQTPGCADRIDLLSLQMLQLLYLQRENRPEQVQPFQEEKIRQIASYLHVHYKEETDLDKLIQSHGLSRRTFYRYWRKFYTESPAQLIQDLRMYEARYTLLSGNASIEELAESLHFSESAYFIKLFRKYFGETPGQYRKRYRERS